MCFQKRFKSRTSCIVGVDKFKTAPELYNRLKKLADKNDQQVVTVCLKLCTTPHDDIRDTPTGLVWSWCG